VNNDVFSRIPDVGSPVQLALTLPNGQPGRDAYEILAFFAVSASLPIGVKPVAYFDQNINIQDYGLPGGNDILANHSYQLNHDAAETWDFYSEIMAQTRAASTHSSPGAGAGTSSFAATTLSPRTVLDRSATNFSAALVEPETSRNHPARSLAFERLGRLDAHDRALLLLTARIATNPRETFASHPLTGDANDFDSHLTAADDLQQKWNSDFDETFASLV
jgi:hypothetical protein